MKFLVAWLNLGKILPLHLATKRVLPARRRRRRRRRQSKRGGGDSVEESGAK